jgi:peroxiredoxin
MKKVFILSFILSFSLLLFGQKKQATEPFIIKGQVVIDDISEYKEVNNTVRIDYSDQYDQIHSDSARFDDSGVFFIETDKILKPVRINLIFDFDSYPDILAAPGFELTFFKPTKNKHDFKLTGNGFRASKYYRILDSIPASRYYAISWWDLNEADFINKINKTQQLRDSVSIVIFGQNSGQDFYFDYIGRMTHLDNKFEKLKYLFLYAKHKKYSLDQTLSFVRNNFDADFFNNFSNDEYLVSSEFRSGISSHRPDSFLNYLLLMNNPAYSFSDIDNLPEASLLEKANTLFKGEVRAFVLYKIIAFPIWKYKTIDDLNTYKDQIKPYLSSFSPSALEALDNAFTDKMKMIAIEEDELTKKEIDKANSFIGNPAPPFCLKTRNDRTHSLKDFKGKVVVLDLWSSWCNLCSIENKALKKIYRKFRGNKHVEFIGIGVLDSFDEWKSALKLDRPVGIQLFDSARVVFKGYIDERIPKFVVIDKQGKVVTFMAPKPSEGDALEKMIRREIEK